MRRCALNRFFIAAPAQAFVTAFFIFVGVLAFAVSAAEVHAEAALAFGYDSGGRCWYGTAWNYRTKDEARSAAMQRCLQKGAPCEVVLQTSNGCIALATGTSSNASGLAARSSKEDAQREALQTCVRYNGGRACAIREVFCDTVSEEALAQEHEGNEPEVQPRPNDADKRGREAADAEQQKQTEALKRELEESERAPARSAEQDTRAAARRALEAAFDGCRLYVKDSCETALRSLVISDNERADALVWRGIAKKFANDQAKCTNGTPDACEAAIASPAADANDRERLEKLKGVIPLRVPLVEQARPQAVPPVESPTPAATPTTGEWLTWLKELAASIADVVTYARSAVPIYVLIASGLVLALAWLFLARLLRFARWLQGRVAAWLNRPQGVRLSRMTARSRR